MNKSRLKKLITLFEQEKYEDLEAVALGYIKANKKDGLAWKALGTALYCQNKDAVPACRRAIELLPTDSQAYFNFANVLYRIEGQKQQAIAYYRRALELKPDYAECYSNLGNALAGVGEPYEALKSYFAGIKLAPHLVNIQLNMGNCYLTIGQHARALRMYQMALEIKPDFIEASNAILFARDLFPDQSVHGAQSDRRTWAAKFADPLIQNKRHRNVPDPERRLKIGYVSADFREHSAARSCGSIIVHHDREKFEVFAYDTTHRDADDYTKMFKANVDHWRKITKTGDQEVADIIRKDGIDILVDLSGHSGGNRLQVFARKPAPIQCTGWGYATGTGMKAMDVLFADKTTIPDDEVGLYAEEVRHLSCIDGPLWVETFPEVSESPALMDGNISFGSLNRMAKVTQGTLELWARVLKAVPNSGMIIKAGEFSEENPRERVLKSFADLGIPPERLILVGATPWYEHMEAYQQIDISLDPFPQGGGVTTLEGLMMGVPVIALRWPTIPGRVSASILTRTGLGDWVAETQDDYVAKAVAKASDIPALAALRKETRGMFQRTVGNGKAYAIEVEAQYRFLWRRWCEKQGKSEIVDTEEIEA